jgi:hypothetical protein
VPHNFIITGPRTPNPGRWTRAAVEEIARRHNGTLEYLWFDDLEKPTRAYVLVRDGDADGLMRDLHGHEVTRLHEER